MFCTKCGTRNDENATTCIQCGNALRPASFGTPLTPPTPPLAPPQTPLPVQQYQAPIAQGYAAQPPMAVQIPNYLIQSILVTIFCCLPFGIVSIIFAAQVNSKAAAGDIAGAMQSSKQAKLFAWIGFGCGGAVVLIYAILIFVVGIAGIARHAH
ncbi:conserved hypothetical protein [Candidatus Koribacter versatilis Ellin345]|uniref:Zinc-ribbon domain-containing protein n=1 Tax=Koribacter versatilis (strain Ellin345) TaxID=204669 RepID=Q1IQG3_KORVE|nr:CD225/dispanin family protein [Candidatus Koribacter versatilis]ABF40887.1 conserved hypothetical protein [Candidatus Koribacter versatilis Ellin345]